MTQKVEEVKTIDQGFSIFFRMNHQFFFAASVLAYHLKFPETSFCFITQAQAQFRVSLKYELTLR